MKANVPKKNKGKQNNWKIPKNAADYFHPHYDDDFKAEHPLLYWLTVIAIIAGVMVGPAIYLFFCSGIQTTFNDNAIEFIAWAVGFVASMGISIGILNIFMILHKQYLGHYVTLFSFVIGILGPAISLLILWLM